MSTWNKKYKYIYFFLLNLFSCLHSTSETIYIYFSPVNLRFYLKLIAKEFIIPPVRAILQSPCPSVRPFVCPFVRPSVHTFVTDISPSTGRNDFIFDIWLWHGDLYVPCLPFPSLLHIYFLFTV